MARRHERSRIGAASCMGKSALGRSGERESGDLIVQWSCKVRFVYGLRRYDGTAPVPYRTTYDVYYDATSREKRQRLY